MARTEENEESAQREVAKEVVFEFSKSPQNSDWEVSTPSKGVETRTSELSSRVPAVSDFSAPPPLPRQIANRYDVVGFLGTGGQAEVYLADDTTLGRKVAIKISKSDRILSHDEQEQFQREARAIASLKHPGIVTVHDFGINDDERCFIVLEYLPGRSLKDCLKKPDARQIFTVEHTLELVCRLAEALHYAHQRGIYHRDLKPGNVLLDEDGNPHISDFGLAVTQETQTGLKGQVAGTAAFMSPEQVRGESDWLSGQADIWALGVILYEMLAGRRPFQGKSEEEIYEEILHRVPTSVRQINGLVSADVDRIVLTCLVKETSCRYASAGDLVRDLKTLRESRRSAVSVSAEPAKTPTRPQKSRSRRVLSIIAALTLLVVFSGLIGSYWNGQHSTATTIAKKDPVAPRQWVRGDWNNLLDRQPEVIRWDATSPNAEWHFQEVPGKVVVKTNRTALLRLGDIQEKDFDLRLTILQTPWTSNGSFGLFFGYAPLKNQEDMVHYQVFTIESNRQNVEMAFSVDRKHIIEHPTKRRPFPEIHIPAAERIDPPPFGSITILVSIRDNRVIRVVANGKELPELSMSGPNDIVASTRGPLTLDANGAFGCYVGASSEGMSGTAIAL